MTRTVTSIDAGTLPDDVDALKAMIADLLREYQHLEHRLQALLRQRFGASAERVDPEQLKLFAAEILAAGASGPEVVEPPAPAKEHSRRNGRRRLPTDLPRIRVEHDLSEQERACPCCGELRVRIGEQISEQLEYEPAKLHVIEHVQLKYVCRGCEGQVETAPKARQAIEKCLAGPGLLAQVAVSKYADHLPLHRLEGIFKRHGVQLNRSTMCDWMRMTAEALSPLQALMKEQVLRSSVLHTDDTPLPVQEKGRGATKTGRFWVYVGDEEHRYAVFDYTPSRSRAGPVSWLSGFSGHLQADAYAGYEALYATGKVVEVACWAHARRKFHDARMTDPGRCHQAIAWIKRLSQVEREAKEMIGQQEAQRQRPLSMQERADIRLELRRRHTAPLLEQLKTWLDDQARDVLPKSPVAEAIAYVRSRWQAFTRYASDGTLDMDNNEAENALRAVALGRKNWLFAGSDRGGQTAAVLMSLIASCKLHEVEPWSWLADVLRRLPDTLVDEVAELLPDRWKARQAAGGSSINPASRTA